MLSDDVSLSLPHIVVKYYTVQILQAMKLRIEILCFIVIASYSCFAEEIRVAPDHNATNGSTCVSLTDCAKQNYTSHTKFILLPGNHILETNFYIFGFDNISFSGENVTIDCGYQFGLTFENISGLKIEGISFVSCGNSVNPGLLVSHVQYGTFSDIVIMSSTSTAVNIRDSINIEFSNLLVTNNEISHMNNSVIMLLQNSQVNFTETTTFSDNLLGNVSPPSNVTPICLTPSYERTMSAVLLAERCNISIDGHFMVFNNTSPTAIIRINEAESFQIIGISDFKQNSVGIYGVLSLFNSKATIAGSSNFSLNTATSNNIMEFKTVAGIHISCSTLNVTEHIEFNSNTAGVSSCNARNSIVRMSEHVLCQNNSPPTNLPSQPTNLPSQLTDCVRTTLFNLEAENCGTLMTDLNAVIKLHTSIFYIKNSEFIRNKNSFVLEAIASDMFFSGENRFDGNSRVISSRSSRLKFVDNLDVSNNNADGTSTYSAIHLDQCQLFLYANFLFKGNTRPYADGGVIFAQASSSIIVRGNGTFEGNSARLGGVCYLQDDSFITLLPYAHVSFVQNFAEKHGGVMYISKFNLFCGYNTFSLQLPCFLQFVDEASNQITFSGNFVRNNGTGSLLYSDVQADVLENVQLYNYTYINMTAPNNTVPLLDSEFYRLYFCENEMRNYSKRKISRTHKRGEKVKLMMAAFAFDGNISSGTAEREVRGLLDDPSIITSHYISMLSQMVTDNCSEVTFQVFSPHPFEEIAITANGYCRSTDDIYCLSLNLTFADCDNGFEPASNPCKCDNRLLTYTTSCDVDTGKINKSPLKNPWIGAHYQNSSNPNSTYLGLILYPYCPPDYCQNPDGIETVAVSLKNPDAQCRENHGGLLCGACKGNTSLKLHSMKCADCSDNYAFVVIIAMFVLGILFIAFLSLVQFTVSSGTVHGILFYANILSAKNTRFGVHNEDDIIKFLDIFIGWVNLDFGMNICFYDGLNQLQYISWQFVFPLYLCAIVLVISIICHYSIKASKFFAKIHDPVAVFETVVLFSYSKFIRNIIDIVTPAHLEYPSNNTSTVWLRDGTVPFGTGGHTVLVIIAVILGLIMILGTTVTFLSQWLYKSETISKLFSRYYITASLNTYHAAFKPESRYWVSLCNMLRWVLMLTFALDEGFHFSLLAICTVCTLLLSIISVSGGIYNSRWLDLLEVSFIVNLLLYYVGVYHVKVAKLEMWDYYSFFVLHNLSTGSAFLIFVLVICMLIYKRLYKVCIEKNLELLKKRFKKPNKQVNISETLENDLEISQVNAVELRQHTSRTYRLMRFSKLRETLLEESV